MRRGNGHRASMNGHSAGILPSCTLLISTLMLIVITTVLVMYTKVHHHSLFHSTAAQHVSSKRFDRGTNARSPQALDDLKKYVRTLEGVVNNLESTQNVQFTNTVSNGANSVGGVDIGSSDAAIHQVIAHQQPLTDRDVSRSQINPADANDMEIAAPEQLGSSDSGSSSGLVDNVETKEWLESLTSKLRCMWLHCGAIYLYHTRKAAGTTIREILSFVARQWRVPYYETEGIVLHQSLINYSGILSVTSLRDPVKRVLSLYWYEHVGWYDGILHKTEKCKPLREWLAAWRDGSSWKSAFVQKNRGNVYVEVSNYYTKMLAGWRGETLTDQHLETAKAALRKFDVVLLSDWMGDDTQVDAMNALFPGREKASAGKLVQGDFNAKERLRPQLAPDEEQLMEQIRSMNSFDLQLWDYAQSLMAYRLKLIAPAIAAVKQQLGMDSHRKFVDSSEPENARLAEQCKQLQYKVSKQYQTTALGIFQPPGHKGPF